MSKPDLFLKKTISRPLADLLRPQTFDEIFGQDHLLDKNGALALIATTKSVPSLVLQGPAGVGKTSIAKILAKISGANFVMLSAINSGAADIRKVIEGATKQGQFLQDEADIFSAAVPDSAGFATNNLQRTILMIDEIHHFNKTQQDLFLPFIEDGTIILIATTTENPSFHLNSALLSRCKVLTLNSLDENALRKLLKRAENFVEKKLPLDDEAREALISLACGDARYLLNACEELFAMVENISAIDLKVNKKLSVNFGDEKDVDEKNSSNKITKNKTVNKNIDIQKKSTSEELTKLDKTSLLNKEQLFKIITKRAAHFDKKGEFHYNLISAFHKSLRGSDVDAALYYLARMMVAGEDAHYILRRLARFATEDIGLADPQALVQVMMARENYDYLGSPEGDYALSHATIYCATAPKSNASYLAHKEAISAAQASTQVHPPKHILNASTKMMKEQGLGVGYIYDHDTPNCFSGQEYFPDEILRDTKKMSQNFLGNSKNSQQNSSQNLTQKQRPKFYEPNERGFERDIKRRLEYWSELRNKLK